MTEHISAEQIKKFRERTISAEDLLYVDHHSTECSECQEKLQTTVGWDRVASAIMDDFRNVQNEEAEHATYEDLERWVDGVLPEVDQQVLETHLEVCGDCNMSAKDLLLIRRDLAKQESTNTVPGRVLLFRRASLIAAVAACFAFIVLAVMFPLQNRVMNLESQNSSQRATQQLLADAISTGQLPIPAFAKDLAGKTGGLRGTNESVNFALLSPVATAVQSNHPVFQWTPVAGADSYTVSVFDSNFNVIVKSEPLKSTEWSSNVALPDNQPLAWQVVATGSGKQWKAPMPPAAPAMFRVLGPNDRSAVYMATRNVNSPLVLGIVYSSFGLFDNAREQFEIANKQKPASGLAQHYLQQLQQLRNQ